MATLFTSPLRIPLNVDERFVRASGPGGQNVNKVATAVELRFDIDNSSLPADMKSRLKALAGRKALTDGVLMIDSRVHRTQARNREAARERLIDLIQLRLGAAEEAHADRADQGRQGTPAGRQETPRRDQDADAREPTATITGDQSQSDRLPDIAPDLLISCFDAS